MRDGAMTMEMIDDAGIVWKKLWSVRAGLATGLLSSFQTGYQIYAAIPNRTTLVISIVVTVGSFATIVLRLIQQPKLEAQVALAIDKNASH